MCVYMCALLVLERAAWLVRVATAWTDAVRCDLSIRRSDLFNESDRRNFRLGRRSGFPAQLAETAGNGNYDLMDAGD